MADAKVTGTGWSGKRGPSGKIIGKEYDSSPAGVRRWAKLPASTATSKAIFPKETGAQKQARFDATTRANVEKAYAERPEPKFHKGQDATIDGKTGPITDVMWSSAKKVWTYSIKVWSEKAGDQWIDGDEPKVKGR